MTTTAFVMAQGEQQRIGHRLVGPKQLIPIFGDQTIFERTIQQIRAAGVKRIVAVVHGGPWWTQVLTKPDTCVETYIHPNPGASVVGGILQCKHLWSDQRNVFFLGDVVYSHSAVRHMVGVPTSGQSVVLYGRSGPNRFTKKVFSEIFGCSFEKNEDPISKLAEKYGVNWTRHQDTKLFTAKDALPWVDVKPTFIEIDDYTDDIDTEDDYVKRLPILRECVIKDVS